MKALSILVSLMFATPVLAEPNTTGRVLPVPGDTFRKVAELYEDAFAEDMSHEQREKLLRGANSTLSAESLAGEALWFPGQREYQKAYPWVFSDGEIPANRLKETPKVIKWGEDEFCMVSYRTSSYLVAQICHYDLRSYIRIFDHEGDLVVNVPLGDCEGSPFFLSSVSEEKGDLKLSIAQVFSKISDEVIKDAMEMSLDEWKKVELAKHHPMASIASTIESQVEVAVLPGKCVLKSDLKHRWSVFAIVTPDDRSDLALCRGAGERVKKGSKGKGLSGLFIEAEK